MGSHLLLVPLGGLLNKHKQGEFKLIFHIVPVTIRTSSKMMNTHSVAWNINRSKFLHVLSNVVLLLALSQWFNELTECTKIDKINYFNDKVWHLKILKLKTKQE